MNQKEIRPPRVAIIFFRWFCHPDIKEDIEGDLFERFYERVNVSGSRKAKLLFVKDVLTLFRPGIIRNINVMQSGFLKNINPAQFMIVHLLVVIFIILPFLPGPHNQVSVFLGMLGFASGFFGLVLIPIGFLWWKFPYVSTIVANIIIFIINLMIVVAAFGVYGATAGIIGILITSLGIYQSIKSIRKIKNKPRSNLHSLGIYLITIPLVALGTRMFITKPMSNYSRNFAIERGQELVTSIEEFKNKQGRYPDNIQELKNNVPSPFIMGIDKFRYTKYKDQYFLAFSQWPDGGITEEIVLFGKVDPEIRWIPQEKYNYKNDMHRVMGAFASYNTSHDHWRYYLCD